MQYRYCHFVTNFEGKCKKKIGNKIFKTAFSVLKKVRVFENLFATQLKITWSPYICTYIFIIPIALRLDKKDLPVTVYQPHVMGLT